MSKRGRITDAESPKKQPRREPLSKIGELLATGFDPFVDVWPRHLNGVDVVCVARVNRVLWEKLRPAIRRGPGTWRDWMNVLREVMTRGGLNYERTHMILVESWGLCEQAVRRLRCPEFMRATPTKCMSLFFWCGVKRGLSAGLLNRFCTLMKEMSFSVDSMVSDTVAASRAFRAIYRNSRLPVERCCEFFAVYKQWCSNPHTNMIMKVMTETKCAMAPFLHAISSGDLSNLHQRLVNYNDVSLPMLQAVLHEIGPCLALDVDFSTLMEMTMDKYDWVVRHIRIRRITSLPWSYSNTFHFFEAARREALRRGWLPAILDRMIALPLWYFKTEPKLYAFLLVLALHARDPQGLRPWKRLLEVCPTNQLLCDLCTLMAISNNGETRDYWMDAWIRLHEEFGLRVTLEEVEKVHALRHYREEPRLAAAAGFEVVTFNAAAIVAKVKHPKLDAETVAWLASPHDTHAKAMRGLLETIDRHLS